MQQLLSYITHIIKHQTGWWYYVLPPPPATIIIDHTQENLPEVHTSMSSKA
jgi:hypothetical protein